MSTIKRKKYFSKLARKNNFKHAVDLLFYSTYDGNVKTANIRHVSSSIHSCVIDFGSTNGEWVIGIMTRCQCYDARIVLYCWSSPIHSACSSLDISGIDDVTWAALDDWLLIVC